jgi:hypothetical protein
LAMSGADDWWEAASRNQAHVSHVQVPSRRSTVSAPGRSPRPNDDQGILSSNGMDPLLAGIRSVSQAVRSRPGRQDCHLPERAADARGSPPPQPSRSSEPPKRLLAGSECLHPVSQVVLREIVETATGLNRNKTDITEREASRDTALRWLRTGAVDPADFFRTVEAGPALADAPFNIRVLFFVHYIIVLAGPAGLAAACETPVAHRPSNGARICLDVLKACSQRAVPLTLLESADDRIRSWSLDASGGAGAASTTTSRTSAVEMYAYFLGRKLEFHACYPEIEANYSLDRFYRQFHIENAVDHERRQQNIHRRAEVISNATALDCALLAKGGAAVAGALDRAKAPVEAVSLVFADASNAFALAQYLQSKVLTASSPLQVSVNEIHLDEVGDWLARRLKATFARGGEGMRCLQRYVEPSVIHAIEHPTDRPVRPESRHRREIPCVFSSFDSMHGALAPATCL